MRSTITLGKDTYSCVEFTKTAPVHSDPEPREDDYRLGHYFLW